jgi:hypothetical protein
VLQLSFPADRTIGSLPCLKIVRCRLTTTPLIEP